MPPCSSSSRSSTGSRSIRCSIFLALLPRPTRSLSESPTTLIAGGLAVCWYLSRDLDILTQGEETAQHLGVDVERVKKMLFTAASCMVAAAVAVAGMIGFVGLIVPHMLRMIVGPNHRVLIPAAALGGAVFLILADTLARTVVAPIEVPVGALTALVGSPYFVYLLRRRHRHGQF